MSLKKKKVLNFLFKESYEPLTFDGLRKALNIKREKDVKRLSHLLKDLEEEGSVQKSVQGRYTPLRGKGQITGTLQVHSGGYAFLLPETSGEQDIFIPPGKLGGAVHKDQVLVRLVKESRGGRRRVGEVVRVLKRSTPFVVGTYQGNSRKGVVLPDENHFSRQVQIPRGGNADAARGDKVLVRVNRWPDERRSDPQGEVVEVIGHPGDPGVDITSIQKKYGLPSHFPPAVLKEAQKFSLESLEETADQEGRKDLRSLPMVTIDGADAKDLDDAVSLERDAEGRFQLGVHIADVSYYVKEGSALDREAAKRGTSVYLPDRVIPMLPPELSNEVCSLNPGVPRMAISVFMQLDARGELQSYEFYPSLVRIDERMTYDDVNRILEGDQELEKRYGKFSEVFKEMGALSRVLKEKRLKRGALDFNFPEAKVLLDEQGKPLDILVRWGSPAESIIEEFMLLCNEVIARHFHELDVPFVYRVHEKPEADKLFQLRNFLTLFDIKMKGKPDKISPGEMQEIMKQVEGTGAERIVNYVLLRSLPQARYSEEHGPHFGLASGCYTHFTSPIRRYPDLLVHRILRATLHDRLSPERSRKLAARLPELALHSSEQERVAMEAERECVELKKVEYMAGREGTEYTAVINGVSSFGFFVELENTVEGLVHVSRLLDDYYTLDEKRYALAGERTGKTYRLGDSVRVRLEKVDLEAKTIDFVPVEPEEG